MKIFFKSFFRRGNYESKSEQKFGRINEQFDKFKIVGKLIDLENTILAKYPDKNDKERLIILFDSWFKDGSIQNGFSETELQTSTIKTDKGRQNILFYFSEIYRIEKGIPEISFDRGLETTECAGILFQEGYDFVSKESDPDLRTVLKFAFNKK